MLLNMIEIKKEFEQLRKNIAKYDKTYIPDKEQYTCIDFFVLSVFNYNYYYTVTAS